MLNNYDGSHKTVIGATMQQARNFLSAIRQQLQQQQAEQQ
jgi:hypothetical protein